MKSFQEKGVFPAKIVAPLAGAWIEIAKIGSSGDSAKVAPLAGAWIEIVVSEKTNKYSQVAPLAGAWIEIPNPAYAQIELEVAPLAGAWIEILCTQPKSDPNMSLPSRERGLKSL